MPTDQGVRFDNHKSTLPVEQPRPQQESETSHVGQPLRPELVFLVVGKLPSQKKVFGNQGRSRPKRRPHEPGHLTDDSEANTNERSHAPHGSRILPDEFLNFERKRRVFELG